MSERGVSERGVSETIATPSRRVSTRTIAIAVAVVAAALVALLAFSPNDDERGESAPLVGRHAPRIEATTTSVRADSSAVVACGDPWIEIVSSRRFLR